MGKEIPEVFVLSPDKRKSYGVVRMITEMSEDIRFNTCSELTFKVAEKVCDSMTGKWVKNPIYENLEKNNLLYVCDDNEYFSFPNRTLKSNYGILDKEDIPDDYGRKVASGTDVVPTYENDSDVLNGFRVQPETSFYDVCVSGGHTWKSESCLKDVGIESNTKDANTGSWFYKLACPDYIQIQPYDIIALRTCNYSGATAYDIKYNKFHIIFYTTTDPNSIVAEMNVLNSDANPVKRFSINSLTTSDSLTFYNNGGETAAEKLEIFKKAMEKGGQFRIAVEENYKSGNPSTEDGTDEVIERRKYPAYRYKTNGGSVQNYGWDFPMSKWIQVYSGQRFCSEIENEYTDGFHGTKLHWFIINDVKDESDGNTSFKTVSAYSYDYTISNRSISLSEDTLPFYIPPQITDIVNSDDWIIDKKWGSTGSTAINAKQYMTSGILNQILDILPHWSVGHISSELMTRYRKVDDVDNSNLYSFLMNDICELYQCYFVFDCDNQTISAYTQEDVINNSNVVLTWQNAIKNLTISDQDTNFMTALRVHTSDDTYGVGLINPTGNSTIYNFGSIMEKLDFIADTSTNDPEHRNQILTNGNYTGFRTLKQAVTTFTNYINNPNMSITVPLCTEIGNGYSKQNVYTNTAFFISSLNVYRKISKKFVECNLDKIKSETVIENAKELWVEALNAFTTEMEYGNKSDYFNYETIPTPTWLESVRTLTSGNMHLNDSSSLFKKLFNASKQYYAAVSNYEAKANDYNSYLKILTTVSRKANLNYHNQVKLTTQYAENGRVDEDGNDITLSLLTPAEILALQPYIREGDWTNDNSVFSEDYDATDIIDTLVDVYNQAKSDMDLFISKPNYDFEIDMIDWIALSEMSKNFEKLKVGKTIHINTTDNQYVTPLVLELHIDYIDDSAFSMKFTTDYSRKVYQFRFADLFNTISQISVSDNTFNFAE